METWNSSNRNFRAEKLLGELLGTQNQQFPGTLLTPQEIRDSKGAVQSSSGQNKKCKAAEPQSTGAEQLLKLLTKASVGAPTPIQDIPTPLSPNSFLLGLAKPKLPPPKEKPEAPEVPNTPLSPSSFLLGLIKPAKEKYEDPEQVPSPAASEALLKSILLAPDTLAAQPKGPGQQTAKKKKKGKKIQPKAILARPQPSAGKQQTQRQITSSAQLNQPATKQRPSTKQPQRAQQGISNSDRNPNTNSKSKNSRKLSADKPTSGKQQRKQPKNNSSPENASVKTSKKNNSQLSQKATGSKNKNDGGARKAGSNQQQSRKNRSKQQEGGRVRRRQSSSESPTERYAWSSFQLSPDPKHLPEPPNFEDPKHASKQASKVSPQICRVITFDQSPLTNSKASLSEQSKQCSAGASGEEKSQISQNQRNQVVAVKKPVQKATPGENIQKQQQQLDSNINIKKSITTGKSSKSKARVRHKRNKKEKTNTTNNPVRIHDPCVVSISNVIGEEAQKRGNVAEEKLKMLLKIH